MKAQKEKRKLQILQNSKKHQKGYALLKKKKRNLPKIFKIQNQH